SATGARRRLADPGIPCIALPDHVNNRANSSSSSRVAPVCARGRLRETGGKMRSPLLWAAALWLLSATSVLADEVQLTDGETRVGTIESMVDGKMTFKSTTAGELTIPFDKVSTFASDGPIEVWFKDGTVIKQHVLVGPTGSVVISQEGVVQAQSFSV